MVQLIAVLFWLMASPAWSATYYVATDGSNSNDGLTEATPKLTVAHTVSLLVAGDTALVKNGTYNEGVIRFSRSGTASAPITLKNFPGHAPKIVFIQPDSPTFDRIFIQSASGANVAIGWIVISGLELTGGHDGIKYQNLHDSEISHNHIHDNGFMGVLGIGGLRVTFKRNIIHHNGRFAACAAGTSTLCIQDHGLYVHGQNYVITNNVFYWHKGFGIQQNGSSTSTYSASVHAGPEFAGAQNWVVSDNTFAYSEPRGGYVIWGGNCDGLRLENNIFYENAVNTNSSPQGIEFLGAGGSTGITIKNNHFYASGSGGTAAFGGTEPADIVKTGNVINVSPPSFVNGGSNSLPTSPDFRLTASSPVNIALSNEFPNNSTNVVGAFKTIPPPLVAMSGSTMTWNFSSVHGLDGVTASGVSVTCTANPTACPGSPTVGSVSKKLNTDAIVEGQINGIASDACLANQAWRGRYDGTGTWTELEYVGTYPGFRQAVFDTGLILAADNCDGTGTPSPPISPHIHYAADDGSGTTVTDDSGNALHGTLVGGSWGTGKTGGGLVFAAQSGHRVDVPWGSGINPTTQSFTVAFGVFIDAADVCLSRTYLGASLGTSQRFYVSMLGCTWRIGIQTSNDGTASELNVVPGWNFIVLQMDKDTPGAGTGTATLCVNRVCSMSAGGKKTYTSYTLASNVAWGYFPGQTVGGAGTHDEFSLYLSVVDQGDLYDAFNTPPPPVTGTFSQTAVQFQDVFLPSAGGSPRLLDSPNNTKSVVQSGAVAFVAQIECNGCAETAFRLESRDNGVGDWAHVPNTETAANTYMWGQGGQEFLNAGVVTTRVLANGCTVVQGSTQLTASQIPSLTLPSSGCTILRYLIRVRSGASGFTEFRLTKEGGVAFAGTYVLGRITITTPQAGGVGL